jgi:hypothetical protein
MDALVARIRGAGRSNEIARAVSGRTGVRTLAACGRKARVQVIRIAMQAKEYPAELEGMRKLKLS